MARINNTEVKPLIPTILTVHFLQGGITEAVSNQSIIYRILLMFICLVVPMNEMSMATMRHPQDKNINNAALES